MNRPIAVILAAATIALAGCSATAPIGHETAGATAPASSTAATSPTSPTGTTAEPAPAAAAGAPADGQTLNERGNLTGAIGQMVSPFDPSTASVVGTFTITSVAPSECDTDAVPESGKFLSVTMNAQGAPAADNPDSLPFYANSGGGVLTLIKADGTTWGGVPTTAECMTGTETLPASIGVGEKYAGVIVLDVPKDAAVLVYKPTLGLGYEYALPK